MITRIKSPSAAHTWRQYPQPGSGTQADPYNWLSVSTQSGNVSTVQVADSDGEVEKYYTAKLTASQLYTFSLGGLDEMSTTVTIYKDGAQVAQSVLDYINWTWSCSYTPAETAIYTIKISTYYYGYYYGGGTGTLSVTPTPATITPWTEKTNGVYASTGFDEGAGWTPKRHASLSSMGIFNWSNGLVFYVDGRAGAVDLSKDSVTLSTYGNLATVDDYFNHINDDAHLRAETADPTGKLNLGTGDWTIEMKIEHANTSAATLLCNLNEYWDSGMLRTDLRRNGNAPSLSWEGYGNPVVSATTALASGTAHKIRFVRQGAQIYAFVDDVQEGVAEIAGTKALNFSTPGNKLIIGRNMIEHGSTQFYGKTYWVRIWNRAILDSIPEPSGTAVA